MQQTGLARTSSVEELDGPLIEAFKSDVQRGVESMWKMGRLETKQTDEVHMQQLCRHCDRI